MNPLSILGEEKILLVKQTCYISGYVADYLQIQQCSYRGWFSNEIQVKYWDDFIASCPGPEDYINQANSVIAKFLSGMIELRGVPGIARVFSEMKEFIDRELDGACSPIASIFEQASEIFVDTPTLQSIN